MKKSFIALAVAGAVAAPLTANAADVTYSGIVESYLYLNDTAKDGNGTQTTNKGPYLGNGKHDTAGDVQFNVGVTEDVGFGTAFANMRLDLDSVSGSGITTDSIRTGLTGDFGTVTLGEGTDYSESGQLANDIDMGSHVNPDSALSYEAPQFVPGLTIGANIITTTYSGSTKFDAEDKTAANVDVDDGTITVGDETERTGLGFGLQYSADLGNAGSITAGYGSQSFTTLVKGKKDKSDLQDLVEETSSYNSFGLRYSIAGVSIAFAQQSKPEGEITTKATDTNVEAKKVAAQAETDIQLGYSAGPISASYTTASRVVDQNPNATGTIEDKDKETTYTTQRIDLGYSLSDNVSVGLRNQSRTNDVTDAESGYTRVSMTVSF